MTVYSFSPTLTWDLGGSMKIARSQRVNVLDPATGATAPDLEVDGQPVQWVTSDADGVAAFTSTLPRVQIVARIGNRAVPFDIVSPDAFSEAITASADAASAASAAADSASSAAASAALVGAPAKSAMDAAMGGDVAGLVPAVAGKVTATDRPVSLRGKPGIDWTGGSDSSAAVQAVLDAAGTGAKIDLGKGGGRIRLDTGLTLSNFQHLEGVGQSLSVGMPAPTELYFPALPANAVGITGGISNTLTNVLLRGPGYTAASQVGFKSSTASSPRFIGTQFYSWPTAVDLTGAYYTVFDRCEWMYNALSLNLHACYNVDLFAPKFRCSNSDASAAGTAIAADVVRPLSVYGGSIESYTYGIQAGVGSQISVFGTYWETLNDKTGVVGVVASPKTGTSIGLFGCLVYLYGHNRWVDFGGGTAQSLVSKGNKFISPTTSSTTPIAYALASTGSSSVDISGDNWADVQKGTYLGGSAVLPLAGFSVTPPVGATNAGVPFVGPAKLQKLAAQADTSGATLSALETEVNGLKAKLRALGFMS